MKKNQISDQIYSVTKEIAQLMNNFEFMQKKCSKLGRVECNLLHYLITVDRQVSMKELAKHLAVTHSRITHLMDSLIRKNFIIRLASDDDRRVFYAEITKEGKDMVHKHVSESVKSFNKILGKLEDQELDNIYEALQLWKTFLSKLPQDEF